MTAAADELSDRIAVTLALRWDAVYAPRPAQRPHRQCRRCGRFYVSGGYKFCSQRCASGRRPTA